MTENDWLTTGYSSAQSEHAFLLTASALVQIAKECCNPPLSLDDTKEILENVWYEMD